MADTNGRPRPARMRLRGVFDEAVRNLVSGTSHACAMAVTLICLMTLCMLADLASITTIQRRADSFVASGGSTYSITFTGHIDGAACDRLASLDGVIASGAVRSEAGKLTFATLPSTGVPTYEATPGATGVFANSATTARDAVRPGSKSGVWLSQEAAKPLDARPGDQLTLRDDRTVDVAGVYDWPDDGRQSGYSYAAVMPVPASDDEPFDQCWVKAWPVPENIESLLRVTTKGDESVTQERPTVAQLNTSQGRTFDAIAAYRGRLTVWSPLVAGVVALLIGWIAVHLRRLELASALHCGVPKSAMVVGVLVETSVWTLIAIVTCVPVAAWMWLENTDTDAMVLTDTLLRVPVAVYIGVLIGAMVRAGTIRERQLFRYFKNR